ncbi:MAG: hypothetical protein A2666_04440 [Parcubacteria group bacterium RIFCSPHIGHO2_01_FULL_47_10b]|nr:MAG: hypothetical protein A2666_04440 [Parcubacteria group bacterium RIFCSPHIGHO2_01_FULL_47_10b]
MENSQQLPDFFRPIMWSYDLSRVSPEKNITEIITNTLNVGMWEHLKWVVDFYGKERVQSTIINIPETALRPGAIALAKALFNIETLTYASRSDKIRQSATI